MAFFGMGRNERPPRDFEAERRRLGGRYLELDRTATRDAAGVARPPAGLFVDADEAAGYLGARARSRALPIEAPTTAGTVAQYRASLDRPPAISGTPFVMGPPGQSGAQGTTREGPRVEPNRPARPPADPAGMAQTGAPPPGMPGITINLGGNAGAPPAPPVGPPAGVTAQPPPPMDPAGQTVPARAEPNQPAGGQWKRNKRTGELRFFAEPAGPQAGAADASQGPAREGPRAEPNQGTVARRYSAAPAGGAARDEQVRAGLVQPGVSPAGDTEARDLSLRRQGLQTRAGNTGLSAAARADARRQLAELDQRDRRAEAFRMADRQDATTRYVADAAAAGEVAKAQAAAAGKSPVFALPNGKQAMVVGNTLVDAQTQEILADARSTGGIDPMVFMSATDEQRKLMIEKLTRG